MISLQMKAVINKWQITHN